MSHYVTKSGLPYVECDEPLRIAEGGWTRCSRRSFGPRDRFGDGPLNIFDLPRGWSVAPHSDDHDHGATRTSLLDGSPIPPVPAWIGVKGDLHTCGKCNRARRSR